MKFEFKWQSGFWGNYVLMCWWDSKMSNLGWEVKGQLWPLKLIYSHCLIWFNISSENNDWPQQFSKNEIFKKVPFKCIRKQIWPWRWVGQGQLSFIIWTNLLVLTSPMLHTKSQGHRPSRSGEDFYMIFTIYGCGGHLSHVNKIFCINFGYHKESSHEIWVQLSQWFVRKLCFNILMGLQYEWPKLKGQRSTLTFWTYL